MTCYRETLELSVKMSVFVAGGIAHHFQEMLVDSRVRCKLGVKGGGKNATLLDQHGMTRILCKDFNTPSNRFDDRRAYENHLQRFLAKFRRPGVDVACELAAVAVAQNGNVDKPE